MKKRSTAVKPLSFTVHVTRVSMPYWEAAVFQGEDRIRLGYFTGLQRITRRVVKLMVDGLGAKLEGRKDVLEELFAAKKIAAVDPTEPDRVLRSPREAPRARRVH